jgi:uncharacterized protein YciI
VIVFHVAIETAGDYVTRREPHRRTHLERLMGLRAQGLVIGGGPSPDGRGADIFYRVQQPDDLRRLVEEDPYFTGGAWSGYRPRSFAHFLALIEARGAGRMAFGGFFPGGETLAVMRAPDAAKALEELRASGFWQEGSLRARPLLHVL